MKLAAEPRSSSRAPACVLAGVWSLTRKLLLISHLLALFLAKPSTVLTCFAATEDDAEVAGKAGGKACPNKSPGLVRRKLEGTDCAPVWLDVALHPAGPWGQLLLTLADPMKSQNSGEPFGLAWLFWVLKQRCVLSMLLIAEEKSRANQDPPPSLGETQHVALAESASFC